MIDSASMKTELSKLRQQLENKRDSRGRVPPAIKREALLIIERARQNGMSYRAISKQIGVNNHTLRYWRETSKTKSVIKAVRIAEPNAKPKSEVVLVGPRGLRIEGLNLSDLAELLVRLA
jgi:DNA invertase Pin-like site-specific DNA recombinase